MQLHLVMEKVMVGGEAMGRDNSVALEAVEMRQQVQLAVGACLAAVHSQIAWELDYERVETKVGFVGAVEVGIHSAVALVESKNLTGTGNAFSAADGDYANAVSRSPFGGLSGKRSLVSVSVIVFVNGLFHHHCRYSCTGAVLKTRAFHWGLQCDLNLSLVPCRFSFVSYSGRNCETSRNTYLPRRVHL